MMAQEMRAAGIPLEDAAERLKSAAELIARLTYADGPPAA
jgi:hypothetical protein